MCLCLMKTVNHEILSPCNLNVFPCRFAQQGLIFILEAFHEQIYSFVFFRRHFGKTWFISSKKSLKDSPKNYVADMCEGQKKIKSYGNRPSFLYYCRQDPKSVQLSFSYYVENTAEKIPQSQRIKRCNLKKSERTAKTIQFVQHELKIMMVSIQCTQ